MMPVGKRLLSPSIDHGLALPKFTFTSVFALVTCCQKALTPILFLAFEQVIPPANSVMARKVFNNGVYVSLNSALSALSRIAFTRRVPSVAYSMSGTTLPFAGCFPDILPVVSSLHTSRRRPYNRSETDLREIPQIQTSRKARFKVV